MGISTTQNISNRGLAPPKVVQVIILIVYFGTILTGTVLGDDYFPPSYFSKKHNLVNKILAKKAWLWTTIVFILHYLSSFSLVPMDSVSLRSSALVDGGENKQGEHHDGDDDESSGVDYVSQDEATKMIKMWRKRVWVRYFIQTGYFILFTQWCFGPPIMDKVFWWTGGACMVVADTAKTGLGEGDSPLKQTVAKYSSHCRQMKGSWQGGHDPSGHVFLLVHASLFLWYELLPILQSTPIGTGLSRKSLPWGSKLVLVLLAIWWWILAMTCVYFHTVYEKLSGGFAGLVGWGLVYVAPRYFPLLQRLFYAC